jgi:hypothetical protein
MVGHDRNTSYSEAGYQLNVAYSGGVVTSANLGGAADGSDDGSIVVDGDLLTVVDGPAKGLKLLYTGSAAASGVQIDLSVGVGAQIHRAADALVDETSGLIANEIDALEGQNEIAAERVFCARALLAAPERASYMTVRSTAPARPAVGSRDGPSDPGTG